VGAGFPAFTMTTPLPLLEKPTKQELPQPVSPMAVNIATQLNLLRRRQRENRMDLLQTLSFDPVESASQSYILRCIGNL
jgi:hypothetical protein